MLKAALFGHFGRPVDQGFRPLEQPTVNVRDHDPGWSYIGHVTIFEEDDPIRVGEDCRHVTGDERLLTIEAHHQRHILASPYEAPALLAMHHDDGVCALDPAKRRPDGVRKITLVGFLNQVGERLGVRFGVEPMAARLETIPQFAEVLDDPVVDDGDLAGAVQVGMGVEVVRPTVGRPACMRKTHCRMGCSLGERRRQVGELAGLLLDEQGSFLIDKGDSGGVVAAIFETPKPLDENGARLAGTGVSDDAAHP